MAYGLLSIGQTNPSFDRNGRAVTAELRWYVNNTNTPATVYQDEAGLTPHDFPITSDASGVFPLVYGDDETLYGLAWNTLESDPQERRWNDINVATSANQTILTLTEAARDEAEQIADDLGDLETALAAADADAAAAAASAVTAAAQAATATTKASEAAASAVTAEFWAGQAEAAAGGDFQASNANLTAIAGLTLADNKIIVGTGAAAVEVLDYSTVAQTLNAQTSQANMRTTGLGMSANGSSLVAAADYAAMKALLDLEIGTDVQAYDALLQSIAGLTFGSGSFIYGTGSDTAAVATITAAGRAILDDADAAAQRTTLDVEQLGVARGINTQTDNYTLVASDAGKFVHMNKASGVNLTVPPNSSVAFAVGTYVNVYQQGAGQVTVVAGSGVTIRSSGSKLKLTGQYSGALLWKTATDTWELVGDITS